MSSTTLPPAPEGASPDDIMLPDVPPVALRAALGRFATGVTIITCLDPDGQRVGLTANSFNALSLEPALVLWSLRKVSSSLAAFEGASHFVVNVLADSQVDLSRRFASPAPEKFAEGLWSELRPYGIDVTAAVARDNVWATQFHPEKSASIGMGILANFLTWAETMKGARA